MRNLFQKYMYIISVNHQNYTINHRFKLSFPSRKPSVTENTIASLKQAGAHGADYVEFDVQLTKDLQLVVYHDFRVVTTLAKQGFFSGELYEMLVKDLTLSQLQSLKLEHSSVLSQHNRHLKMPEGVRSASQSSGGETSHDSDSSLETYWGTGYKEDLPERKTFPLLKLVRALKGKLVDFQPFIFCAYMRKGRD